jgi:hypothetical protein
MIFIFILFIFEIETVSLLGCFKIDHGLNTDLPILVELR